MIRRVYLGGSGDAAEKGDREGKNRSLIIRPDSVGAWEIGFFCYTRCIWLIRYV